MGLPRSSTLAKGLPNDPMFAHLVHAAANANRDIIRDPVQNIKADYGRFLQDILLFRHKISSLLPTNTLDGNGMIKNNDVYILLSAPSSYQFLVALFAIIAAGGAAVLLPPNKPPKEITTLAKRCNALAFVFMPEHQLVVDESIIHAKEILGMNIVPIPIALGDSNTCPDICVAIDDTIEFPMERPALVQFTSGTTGSPKGVVHGRKFFYHLVEVYFGCSMREANGLQHLLGPNAVYLSYRSFHVGGGIRNAVAALLAGVCIEIYDYDVTPMAIQDRSLADIWERLSRGDVKFFICWAAMWTQMKRYYEEVLSTLPPEQLETYTKGVRELRLAKSDSTLLAPSVKRFWSKVLGVSIGVNYAATETSIMLSKPRLSDELLDERSIGVPLAGVCVKLSEGDYGEIRVKTPLLFSQYIGEPEATRAVLDQEGYYKTGDIGHYDGKQYVIDGRVSQNFIVFNGCRVLTMEVETSLMELPYITEAYVLGVPDTVVTNRTTALIRVKEGKSTCLRTLRADLAGRLAEYQLPTLLRKLGTDENIPKTHSAKFNIREARRLFFPQQIEGDIMSMPREVEVWELNQS